MTALVHNGRLTTKCEHCGEVPFIINPVNGVVYIVSSPLQVGVKIGMTEKSVEQRLKGLNATGTAGKLMPIAIFPSAKPKANEKKVHDKLLKYSLGKEHFDLTPVEAVLKVFRTLGRNRPIFYDAEVEKKFDLQLKIDKSSMEMRLLGNRKQLK
jgi:hypothetical protein